MPQLLGGEYGTFITSSLSPGSKCPWFLYSLTPLLPGSYIHCSDWREPKKTIEKRKRNLKTISLILRGEREIWISFPQFWEEKEKSEKIFSTLENRNRKVNSVLKLREKKEKSNKIKSIYERRKRNLKFYSLILRVEREKWPPNPPPSFFLL